MHTFKPFALASIALVSLLGTASAGAQAPMPPTTGSFEKGAVLRPGDVLRLTVWQRPELSGDFTVAEDCTLAHPVYHALRVGDVGLDLLEPRVREFLKTYQQEPQVTLQPLFHVAVSGQVRTPNLFLVPPSSSVSQIIAMAGGPTDHGRMNRVRLVRADTEIVLDLAHASPTIASMLVRSGDQVWVDPQLSVMRDYVFPAAGIISAAAFLTRVILFKR